MSDGAFYYFKRLERVDRWVENNLGEDISLADVARIAGMNPSAFSRFFRASVGRSFAEWLTTRRVSRAKGLIAELNLPLSRVAVEVGYGSERTFRRAFRRFTGCSPSEYRLEVRAAFVGGPGTTHVGVVRHEQRSVR